MCSRAGLAGVLRPRRLTGAVGIDGFASPVWFALLLGVAAVFGAYFWVSRRRRRHVVRFANMAVLDRVAPKRPNRLRMVPPVLFLVAFVALTAALAGPMAEAKVPRNRATVMLVIDVSPSMDATDIQPSRIKAAQAAAKSFVENMTGGVNLGLVTYGGSATVDVSPTTARKPVADAIDNIQLQPATATGEAIAAALQSIQQFERGLGGPAGAPPAQIVLMSDGKQTAGRTSSRWPRSARTPRSRSTPSPTAPATAWWCCRTRRCRCRSTTTRCTSSPTSPAASSSRPTPATS
ncbi:hypothetical protein GCM10018954_099720 [Kutzneria kofuensis]